MKLKFATLFVLLLFMARVYGRGVRLLNDRAKAFLHDKKARLAAPREEKVTYDEFGPVYDDEDDFDGSFAQEDDDVPAALKGAAAKKVKQVNKVVTAESRPISNFRPAPH
eukprot:TRINITY_DN4539_c0_g1_i23.p1 TRINITY_DN4539_c0_g1~~TRINITY_DN4539_c0_g1_i23.p1  ORF type:complete len:110 (-),score=25.69 TRINITY_DN4539_c0_g1_i23:177-506(-)